ncbi:hypothetical protein ACF0H5_013904 [Mactra antiquata]
MRENERSGDGSHQTVSKCHLYRTKKYKRKVNNLKCNPTEILQFDKKFNYDSIINLSYHSTRQTNLNNKPDH